MATISIDVDPPPGVTITAYERQGNGHGFEVSWPWPDRCRCDHCRREDKAYIEVKDSVQVRAIALPSREILRRPLVGDK